MHILWRRFRAALSFLTVVPAGGRIDEEDLAASVFFYPVVGLLLGGVAASGVFLLGDVFPPALTALLTVALVAVCTGGFHLDGLADTADGLGSARSRERMLAIMRDSHIGVMGMLALFFVLGVKVVALAGMPTSRMAATALCMPVTGRVAILLMMNLLPYARDEGCAAVFYRQKSPRIALTAGLLGLLVVGAGSGALHGLVAVGAALVVTLLLAWYCRRAIGGATGDTLGAACELAEAVVALVMAAGSFV